MVMAIKGSRWIGCNYANRVVATPLSGACVRVRKDQFQRSDRCADADSDGRWVLHSFREMAMAMKGSTAGGFYKARCRITWRLLAFYSVLHDADADADVTKW